MQTVPEITVETLAAWREGGVEHVLLDVRESWELDICRLEGSLDIAMGQVPGALDRIPRDRPVVVMCHHGMRSYWVAAFLRANAQVEAINLAGGIAAWAERVDTSVVNY
jgi:rhodanese-related sulfurtransferase